MEITAKQSVLDKLVKRADAFTAKDLGSSAHMHSILIDVDADKGTVRFTAENDASAIEFVAGEDIDIKDSGKVLIDSTRLRVILSVIQSDERVTIKTVNEKSAAVTGGRTSVHIPIALIEDEKALLPKVQAGAKDGIKLNTEAFTQAFQTGVVAYDAKGQRPSLNSIHISLVPGEDALRFLSFNGAATAFATADVEKIDNKDFVTLVEPSQIWSALDYINQGTSVILAEGKGSASDKQLHLTVITEDKEGDTQVLYHLRLNTLAGGVAQFPAGQIFERTEAIFKTATTSFSVDKVNLLRLFRSADRIASLNNVGRGKDVDVDVRKEDIRIAIRGEIDFEDFVDLQKWTGEEESFIFRWGLYGNALETYPGDSDIQIGVIRNNGRIVALALVNDADIKFNGKSFPKNYLAVIPTANVESAAIIRHK